MFLYDLMVSTSSAVAEMKQPHTTGPTGAVHTVAFNPRMRSFLACGDSNGLVHVWNLSWGLANVRPGEKGELERSAKAFSEGEGGESELPGSEEGSRDRPTGGGLGAEEI